MYICYRKSTVTKDDTCFVVKKKFSLFYVDINWQMTNDRSFVWSYIGWFQERCMRCVFTKLVVEMHQNLTSNF